jgi:hypothetical protein
MGWVWWKTRQKELRHVKLTHGWGIATLRTGSSSLLTSISSFSWSSGHFIERVGWGVEGYVAVLLIIRSEGRVALLQKKIFELRERTSVRFSQFFSVQTCYVDVNVEHSMISVRNHANPLYFGLCNELKWCKLSFGSTWQTRDLRILN